MKNVYKLSAVAGIVAVSALAGCGGGNNGGLLGGNNGNGTGTVSRTYVQQERLARPLVNEVLATVANNRHRANNTDNPTDDPAVLATDIEIFLSFPAERSRQVKDVIKAILAPDVMVANLSQGGPAAYLGSETNGATGGTFGGRKLQDDVADTTLGIIFGNVIPSLGLAPDDGKEKPAFTSDNVGAGAKNYKSTFPYLGDPR